jgi:hypothetical protein
MESKGRRPPRPSATPVEAVPTAAAPATPRCVEAPMETPKNTSSEDMMAFGSEAFAALVQSQTAVARALEALSVEMAGLVISGIDAVARTATDMLAVKTLSDAIEVNAGFTRSSLDTVVGGSAKLSELAARVAAEASQPILTQLGRSWIKASGFAF